VILPRPWALANEAVVAEDGPRPPVELAAVAGRLRATSSSLAVPPTCPKHRSAAVIHRQPRFTAMTAEL
jgi:hypothetical protein